MKFYFGLVLALALFAGCSKYGPYSPKDVIVVKRGSIKHIRGNEYEATLIREWGDKEWKVFITGEEVKLWSDRKKFGVYKEQPPPEWVRRLDSYKKNPW